VVKVFTPPPKSLLGSPLRIALIYLAAGILWLGVANLILGLLPPHSIALNRFAFTCVTGITLYLVTSRYARRLHESVRAEQESAARARAYFDSAVEGIVQIDPDGSIVQVNPHALAMFGYTEPELIGQPIELLAPARLRGAHAGHRAAFFQAPRSRKMGTGMDIIGARKDGAEFPAEVSVSHVVYENVDRMVAFVSDITARRVMEREARRNETLNALGSVAAAIAHELNNPLAVISSRIELMLSANDGLSPDSREDLQVLRRNVERASRITHNLLSLARQRPGSRTPVDVNRSIEEITMLMFGEPHSASARLELALDRAIPRVLADETGIEQVMVNLLTNAREANADLIRIETGPDPGRPGWIRIVISDNGAGAPPEVLAKVFQPFYTTKKDGTGLGLWLSERVISDHRGTISAHSEPGRGTSFAVCLPGIVEVAGQIAASAPSAD